MDDPKSKNFKCLLSGYDSLYVGYDLDLSCGQIDFEDLDLKKALLRDDPKRNVTTLNIGGLALGLSASGAYPYRWLLGSRDFTIKIARQMQPSVYVQYSSEGLWSSGQRALNQQILDWAANIGAVPFRKETVSRVDYAFDYHLPDFTVERDHFVSRAAKDSQWRNHGATETFSFGTGDVVIRVYNKSAEIDQQSGKTWFHELWGMKDDVWRVEFQFRRGALKSAGINTLNDMQDQIGDLLRETARHHTTLRLPTADTNKSRWPLHPLWLALRQAIDEMPQTGICKDIQPKEALENRKRRVMASILGNLKAISALTGIKSHHHPPPDLKATLRLLEKFGDDEIHPAQWHIDVARRIEEYEAGQW